MWKILLSLVAARAVADEGPTLRCHHDSCRYNGKFEFGEDRYEVDGVELWIIYGESSGYLRIHCVEHSVFWSPAMPRADFELKVWNINVANCQLPANGSLADRLAELNVTMMFDDTDEDALHGTLTIESVTSSSSPLQLTIKHFMGLERLLELNIYGYADARLSTERHFLAPLQSLRSIMLQYVTLYPEELESPKPFLQKLTLRNTGVKRLPEAVHSSTSLLDLRIESENALDAVALSPALQYLDLQSPSTTLKLNMTSVLEKLTLTNWTESQPLPMTRCDNLHKITLIAPAVHALPYGWLANCSNLEQLVVKNARNLTTLPKRLFGSTHFDLTLVAFKEGVLEALYEGQFYDASELDVLDLSGNRLRAIPPNTLPALGKLDLSYNDLDSSVLNELREAYQLNTLNLAHNPRIGDVCDKNGESPLRDAKKLARLFLSNTNVSRICRDWREDLNLLGRLDLSNTSVATLSFKDLQFKRTVPTVMLLHGAPLTLLEMTHDDFKNAKHTPTTSAFIRLNAGTELECDCRMYWTRRVLERSPHVLQRITELRCAGGRTLRELAAEDMVCARPEECAKAALPTTCTCVLRPDDDPDWVRQLVRVSCEHAGLDRVPRPLPHKDRLYELLLAHNRITNLYASELQNIKGLDLRNNSISRLDEETATSLGNIGGKLWLAGNPLECDCSAAPLLQALHARALTDLKNATCGDGTALDAAPVVDCPPSVAWLIGALVTLFVLAVATIGYLASRERRFFAKAVLHHWGLWRVQTVEEERRYDAFVTFSHKDEAIMRELVSRLEPPYRLCVHDRDWVPGLRIPDQIVQSVRESHRTVALVSRHFLASSWARAEFREAHEAAMLEARPRLVVVLLEEPTELQLDERLQRYISTHTYLRWGDPWFYHKLAVALPRPRRLQTVGDSVSFVSSAPRAVAAPAAPALSSST